MIYTSQAREGCVYSSKEACLPSQFSQKRGESRAWLRSSRVAIELLIFNPLCHIPLKSSHGITQVSLKSNTLTFDPNLHTTIYSPTQMQPQFGVKSQDCQDPAHQKWAIIYKFLMPLGPFPLLEQWEVSKKGFL